MTTLIDTIQPPVEYLESILPQALQGRTEEAWATLYISGLASRLQAEPALYRSFGPWWPSLKNMLISFGYSSFGVLNDLTVAAIYTMPRPALTLAAAHLYSDYRFDNGLIFSAQHQLEVVESADDTELYDWESYDEELERTIQAKAAGIAG